MKDTKKIIEILENNILVNYLGYTGDRNYNDRLRECFETTANQLSALQSDVAKSCTTCIKYINEDTKYCRMCEGYSLHEVFEYPLQSEEQPKAKTSKFCYCPVPDREAGYSYCHACHKHVSAQRMEILTRDIESTPTELDSVCQPKAEAKGDDKSCSNCGHHYQNGNKCDARPCRNGSNWIATQPLPSDITNEDIEKWAESKEPLWRTDVDVERYYRGRILGAKAMRDGKIKPDAEMEGYKKVMQSKPDSVPEDALTTDEKIIRSMGKSISLPTDEEIEEKANTYFAKASFLPNPARLRWIEGAKWVRSQAKAIDLEEELYNMMKKFYADEESARHEVKEYLKQRK